jgi:hypothetical protein
VIENDQEHGERAQEDGERIKAIVRNHCDGSMRLERWRLRVRLR